jgi:hypothetical protein
MATRAAPLPIDRCPVHDILCVVVKSKEHPRSNCKVKPVRGRSVSRGSSTEVLAHSTKRRTAAPEVMIEAISCESEGRSSAAADDPSVSISSDESDVRKKLPGHDGIFKPTIPGRQALPRPIVRKLRVFAIDPGLTARFETAISNEMTLLIPWEQDLQPGPIGEYIAIIDTDEHGKLLHDSVDLDRPELLAQDGLTPSDGDPQFRQQMVYAVAMRTIRNFERALGRVVLWVPQGRETEGGKRGRSRPIYRQHLHIHPHYMRIANAYNDVGKGKLFCGYFAGEADSAFPGMLIFTSLSQDVVAHEVTNAILPGMGISVTYDNLDNFAFHKAFGDMVALFQHFWKSDVLTAQIAAIKGKLDEPSALGAVALQFGMAMGNPAGLRNVFVYAQDGKLLPRRPDPTRYAKEKEPHARGDLLVAAVFEAFKKIFDSRVADLRRLATKGTGVLPEGAAHPELIDRFAGEASKSARHLLNMCVRALDYLPAANFTFGDYLRAVITADCDLYPIDERRYRVAFVDAFRSYGLKPTDIPTLSVETLIWPGPTNDSERTTLAEFFAKLNREQHDWSFLHNRKRLWSILEVRKRELKTFLKQRAERLPKSWRALNFNKPFNVISFMPSQRADQSSRLCSQWVIKITQPDHSRNAGAKPKNGDAHVDRSDSGTTTLEDEYARARASPVRGLTLLVDAASGDIRHALIKKQSKSAAKRLEIRGRRTLTFMPARKRTNTRRLRVFAFDPTLGIQLETAGINEITLEVPWERDQSGQDTLRPGPVGEYLEIIDRDPASKSFYEPVDLNHPYVIAQDGLSPTESNPQFHQQMVYAVAMRTIKTFERALGRLAVWSPRFVQDPGKRGRLREEYVQRLRIYPHALREANAYYSPAKKALLFGYFPAPTVPGTVVASRVTVFTCLSHDIIAHEVTHALLDGMHRRFAEASNPDVLAFHEAFADLVALFQHFSLAGVLRHQIAMTRGDLASQNSLGELAQQFGQALGKRGALRSAIGEVEEATGKWKPREPDPADYQRVTEPHARGAILVAAVFDAFLTIYKARVADLLRIASEGTGVLPAGQLHPDLVNRLADEAARAAGGVLQMCIRALDYCPPVDITFGDYLRAIVTADFEQDPIDGDHRRVAMAEAFRRYGIVPEGARTLSVDGLLWRPTRAAPDENEDVLLSILCKWTSSIDLWNLSGDRRILFEKMAKHRAALHTYLCNKKVALSGIRPDIKLEVHSIRPSIRADWEGRPSFQWIVELTQRISQFFEKDTKESASRKPDYYARGGCTLVIDAITGKVRYTIRKTLDHPRIERQRRFILEQASESLAATYFGGVGREEAEPFAMLHRF